MQLVTFLQLKLKTYRTGQLKFCEIHSMLITPRRESSSFLGYIYNYSTGLATSPKFNSVIFSHHQANFDKGLPYCSLTFKEASLLAYL